MIEFDLMTLSMKNRDGSLQGRINELTFSACGSAVDGAKSLVAGVDHMSSRYVKEKLNKFKNAVTDLERLLKILEEADR